MIDPKELCIGDKDHVYCPDRMKCKRFNAFMAEFTKGTLERTPEQLKQLMDRTMKAPFTKIVKSTGVTDCKYFGSIL